MNHQRYQKNLIIVLIIAGLVFLAALYWGNLQIIGTQTGGKLFFTNWASAKTFLVNGYSPYTQESLFQVRQQAALLHLDFSFTDLHTVEPLYGILFYFPFALIASFPHAFAGWLLVNEIALLATFWLLYRLIDWKGNRVLFILTAITVVGWKSILDVLLSGSNALMILFALVAVLFALKLDMKELAGVLLAIVSIKIHLLWLPILFILVYCYVKQKRKTIVWFFAAIVLVSVSLMLLDPAWVKQYLISFLARIISNPDSVFNASSLSQFINQRYISYLSQGLGAIFLAFGVRLGNIFSIIMGIAMIVEWFSMEKRDNKGILWLFSLTMLISTWIGVNDKTELFIFYVPSLFLFLSLIYARWKENGKFIYWIVPIGVLVCNWVVFNSSTPDNLLVFGFYPLLFLLMIYWIRWWALSRNYLVYEWKNQ